ncbi:DUF1361 domain-containing protein [Bacillus sp. TH44]|uniref:DUF1361 domain-containing protein n=1 Tax=unclassified Bacillus (in: firmicutes) TaxID=185979 RepID=UPI0019132A65|nr:MULTISPECIES: DUF1361 domain-containing protein [unclassified Bacillus (in: firmicutes)]MBK5348587.1 DUF1361 domain-containing protein [Bacillus sp. TH45]MBK5361875.1 DUF1361 domain-containing protein [Bacillus sp. TH44]MBK5364512.1 DUF1361 domain-containing protein [Bacillus sp. TH50]
MNERSKVRISFFIYLSILIIFDIKYSFMILNMFLAFAALELSFLLPLFKVKQKSEIPVSSLFYIIFILLSPNVFYVVTDLIHLNIYEFDYKKGLVLEEWKNFFVLTSGVIIAIYYYILMLKQVNNLLQTKWRKGMLFVFILLSSIGIFIGRFLRFHSIHLFTEPLSLVRQFVYAMNGSSVLFIIWLTLLQCTVWWLFVDVKRRGL